MSRVSSFLLFASFMFVTPAAAIAQDHEVELEKALVQTRKAQEQLKRELDEARAHGKRMQQEAEEHRRVAERAREQAEMERTRAQEMAEHLRGRGINPERELMGRLERLVSARELLMQAGELELANNVAERMEQTQQELIRLRIRDEQRGDRDRPRSEPNQRRGDRERDRERDQPQRNGDRDQPQRDRPEGRQNRDQGRRDGDRNSANRDRDNQRRDQQRPAGNRNQDRRPDQRQDRRRSENGGDRGGRDVEIQELREQLQLLRRELEELGKRIGH